mmetsp:Transcript_3827/g.8462  ORF Transcript_3827/g.8462 Transcript_3827/m.8462 type:complete len:219 (-) Transcript_3827:1214-1870(-)
MRWYFQSFHVIVLIFFCFNVCFILHFPRCDAVTFGMPVCIFSRCMNCHHKVGIRLWYRFLGRVQYQCSRILKFTTPKRRSRRSLRRSTDCQQKGRISITLRRRRLCLLRRASLLPLLSNFLFGVEYQRSIRSSWHLVLLILGRIIRRIGGSMKSTEKGCIGMCDIISPLRGTRCGGNGTSRCCRSIADCRWIRSIGERLVTRSRRKVTIDVQPRTTQV